MPIKTAKASPAGWYVDCPECNEPIAEPDSGSHMWLLGDHRLDGKHTHTCPSCGTKIKLPKRA